MLMPLFSTLDAVTLLPCYATLPLIDISYTPHADADTLDAAAIAADAAVVFIRRCCFAALLP